MNCLLTGVGGQGTVLASKILAKCAMNNGLMVRTAETIGMAQRGGCVVSHVKYGTEVNSPLISQGEADIIIAFEPAEAVRALPYLKEDGALIVNTRAIKPVTDSLAKISYSGEDMLDFLRGNVKNLTEVDGDSILTELNSTKVLNLVLLGAASSKNILGFSLDELETVIDEIIPEKFKELNKKAIKAYTLN